MNTRRRLALAASLVALLIPLGCGGGDDQSGGGEIAVETGSLSKPEFIKQADAICQKEIARVQLEFRPFVKRLTSASEAEQKTEAAKFVNTVIVPSYEKQIEEVSSLGAPSGDEKEVLAVLNAVQARLDDAQAQPLDFLQTASPFEKASEMGRAYGFTICAGP